MARPIRVLLLWPGCEGPASGNFGVPQLVLMATHAREETGAEIVIRDLAAEQLAFGPVDIVSMLSGEDGAPWDVIAFSVYSSFDLLKCQVLAEMARERCPDALIAAGGYHASARPTDLVFDGSPFDVCVVGEGEHALVKMIESVEGGAPLRETILASDPVLDLDALPPSDWSFLARYRKDARRIASQAQVYLSRGCPFDCAFCMERAKREVSWRSLSVERAVNEITSLHAFLDLRGWTLYLADALFGMKKSWRREFLEALARADVPAEKLWLLIRVDLVEDEDLALFRDANCGLGFGLESGDPQLLATIRKAGRLDTYLERMKDVAAWARERDVSWGANIICGHPGETPATMERSARYMEELFLDPKGITGFLSIDPFRLYPGSPIDAERAQWEQRFGTVFHRPDWWQDGDQEFLAEWIDPSAELDWRERTRLQHELFAPIVSRIEENFVYAGPARDYFLRAVRDQARLTGPQTRVHYLDRYYAWLRYTGFRDRAESERAKDAELAELARRRRVAWRPIVAERARIDRSHPILDAIERVPRELFVPLDRIGESTRDQAAPLDESGSATVSAMHAYARSFSLLGVAEGQRVLDLGGGSGYGAAILAELVGQSGRVVTVEIDPALSSRAAALCPANVRAVTGDARDPSAWGVDPAEVDAVTVGFAIPSVPAAWLAALRGGTRIVLPIGDSEVQTLCLATVGVAGVGAALERHEPVLYVPVRDAAPVPPSARAPARAPSRRLPVV
jgi:protein-L-isoaspartate(D-aspartate) O-methyltransferase